MTALLALTALAAADGGLPLAVYAERAQLLLPGGNWTESQCTDADGGCSGVWEPTPRAVALEADRADKTAQNAVLRATPPLFSPATWVTIAVFAMLGLVVGGYLTWTVRGLLDGK